MTKQYSLAEVAKHNTRESTWIVINNDVFDITSWLNEHPGGEEVLLENCAKDASERYAEIGHSAEAKEHKFKYKIGELIKSERRHIKEIENLNNSIFNTEFVEKEINKPPFTAEDTPLLGYLMKTGILPIGLGVIGYFAYRIFF